jgi:hypothetical protein
MNRRFIPILVTAVVITSIFAAPATVGAATTGGGPGEAYVLTATLAGQGTLIGNVVVTVPIELTCTPQGDFGPPDPYSMSFLTITQAVSKKAVARGSAYLNSFACDGTAHTYQLTFGLDQSSTVPFKKGEAVVAGNLQACGYNPNTFEYGCGNLAIGPHLIRLR